MYSAIAGLLCPYWLYACFLGFRAADSRWLARVCSAVGASRLNLWLSLVDPWPGHCAVGQLVVYGG